MKVQKWVDERKSGKVARHEQSHFYPGLQESKNLMGIFALYKVAKILGYVKLDLTTYSEQKKSKFRQLKCNSSNYG